MSGGSHHLSDGEDWPVLRPVHVSPHDHFFEDGEEPPERFDLPNRIDYLETNPDPIPNSRWYRLGLRAALRFGFIQYWHSIRFYLQWLLLCLLTLLLQFFLGPAMHADFTRFYLSRMTGNEERFGKSNRSRRWVFTISFANLPPLVTQFLAIFGIGLLSEVAAESLALLGRDVENRIYMWSLFGICSLPILLIHAFLAVRISGFATHLILDYQFGVLEAIQANWRITRSRTWQLVRLKLALWMIQYPIGLVTYGLGILLAEPFCSAVWTAAYLDIAGSEPIREY
jgi:hypothetical protein